MHPSAHDLHGGIAHTMTKPLYYLPHLAQSSPSRFSQQPVHRFNQGRLAAIRGNDYHNKAHAPHSNFNSEDYPSETNGASWGNYYLIFCLFFKFVSLSSIVDIVCSLGIGKCKISYLMFKQMLPFSYRAQRQLLCFKHSTNFPCKKGLWKNGLSNLSQTIGDMLIGAGKTTFNYGCTCPPALHLWIQNQSLFIFGCVNVIQDPTFIFRSCGCSCLACASHMSGLWLVMAQYTGGGDGGVSFKILFIGNYQVRPEWSILLLPVWMKLGW